jgi:nicotinate dehydrogenase subunit A
LEHCKRLRCDYSLGIEENYEKPLTLDVNGERRVVEAEPGTPLLLVLRNDLGLTAAKPGCGLEQCHACAVLIDGEARTTCPTRR